MKAMTNTVAEGADPLNILTCFNVPATGVEEDSGEVAVAVGQVLDSCKDKEKFYIKDDARFGMTFSLLFYLLRTHVQTCFGGLRRLKNSYLQHDLAVNWTRVAKFATHLIDH